MRAAARKSEQKLMADATATVPGDSRCVAAAAAKCEWRANYTAKHQVRAGTPSA